MNETQAETRRVVVFAFCFRLLLYRERWWRGGGGGREL